MDLKEIVDCYSPLEYDYVTRLYQLNVDQRYIKYIANIIAWLSDEGISTKSQMHDFIWGVMETVQEAMPNVDDSSVKKLGMKVMENIRLFYLSHAYTYICKAIYFFEMGNVEKALTEIFRAAESELFLNKIEISIESEKANSHRRKGGKISAQRWDAARGMSIEIATERWEKDKTIKVGQIARDIKDTISADPRALGLTMAPNIPAIKKWITSIAPKEARLPGRPKKHK